MINPKHFKADWLTIDQIAATVESVRKKYQVLQRIPIEILVFAEHDLNLDFHFAPIRQHGLEAALLTDLSGIVFDTETFTAQQHGNRLRFSVAHELGHFYLHKKIYNQIEFKTIEDWLDFVDKLPPVEYQRIEWQADEFAGQLLMPLKQLVPALNETLEDAKREGYTPLGEGAVLDFTCKAMQPDFGVSQAAIQTRLKHAKLWPPKTLS